MPTDTELEQRLEAVESAVAELRQQVAAVRSRGDWLAEVIGSFKDEPAFDEVLAYGRAFRESDRPREDGAS